MLHILVPCHTAIKVCLNNKKLAVLTSMSTHTIEQLEIGDKLTNQQLCDIFGCSPQGGMRKSNSTNTLVLVSNHIESIYEDRWDNDVLHYTGMGTTGHQSLNFAQNKTLHQSNSNGVGLHLFEVFKDKQYTYAGQVILCSEPYTEIQPDREGQERTVYVFPLTLKSSRRYITAEDRQHTYQVKENKAKKLNDQEIALRVEHSTRKPSKTRVKTNVYERNVWVAEFAKRLAKGNCQLCLQPAPFNDKKGTAYLETHHIIWLSQGGEDTPENTVALCPNCHRKMHIVDDNRDIELLTQRAKHQIETFFNQEKAQ